jgi:nitronate monooxygenase
MLTKALGIDHPIIQAPMAGANATPPALVAAVSNAGGLGSLGAAYMPPDQIAGEVAAIRALTSRSFGINLFIPPNPIPAAPDATRARDAIKTYHAELSLPAPGEPQLPTFSFEDQLKAVIEGKPRLFSFTFGLLEPSIVKELQAYGILVAGTATTVEEAILLEQSGVDAIVAQGSEAGGHRGTFASAVENALIGTMTLVPQIVRAVQLPVIASGGMMDGRGIVAALTLGAAVAQLGTAFLTTSECGVAPSYKKALLASSAGDTRLTRAFSGRYARGLANRVMNDLERAESEAPGTILPYPWQNALTRPMRNAAGQRDKAEYLSLWAGQGAPLGRQMPAGELVATLVQEMHA